MGFSSAHVQLDIAKTKNNICFQKSDFETLKPLHLNTLTLNLRTLLAWSVGKTRLQIHHYHGLFLNVTGHSWSPASFATAPVPDNFFCTSTLWVSESQILMGNPQVTMDFNTKMVIHDLDDLGYHFRKLLHVYLRLYQ